MCTRLYKSTGYVTSVDRRMNVSAFLVKECNSNLLVHMCTESLEHGRHRCELSAEMHLLLQAQRARNVNSSSFRSEAVWVASHAT